MKPDLHCREDTNESEMEAPEDPRGQLQSTANWVLVPAVLLFLGAVRSFVNFLNAVPVIADPGNLEHKPEAVTGLWVSLALSIAGTFFCMWGAFSFMGFFVEALKSNRSSSPEPPVRLTMRQSRLWTTMVFASGWYLAESVFQQYLQHESAKEYAAQRAQLAEDVDRMQQEERAAEEERSKEDEKRRRILRLEQEYYQRKAEEERKSREQPEGFR